MKILLTGASGFLGSALARHFAHAGHELVLLLRPGSSLRRLGPLAAACHVVRAQGDADITACVTDARPEALLHTACAYGRAGESPLQIMDANLRFGLLLLQALHASGRPARFVNAGSVLAPEVSAYALAKQQFVDWAQQRCRTGDVRFVNLRLQHMLGPGDDAAKFTTQVLHACHSHQPRLALTAGEQRRDFIHIDDVVAAFDTVLKHAAHGPGFDAFDVGSGDAPTIRHFVETVHRLTASRTELAFGALPYRPFEAMHCQADTARLRALGWPAPMPLATAIQRTIDQEFTP